MLSQLKVKTEASQGLIVEDIIISFPTVLADHKDVFQARFDRACDIVGVRDSHASEAAARAALDFYGVFARDPEVLLEFPRQPAPTFVDTAMSVVYSNDCLEVALLTNYMGTLFPEKAVVHRPDLGASSPIVQADEDEYWKEVRASIETAIKPTAVEAVEVLLLLGDAATQPKLRRILANVFKDSRSMISEEHGKSAEEHLYAAARGGAKIALSGMETRSEARIQPKIRGQEEKSDFKMPRQL